MCCLGQVFSNTSLCNTKNEEKHLKDKKYKILIKKVISFYILSAFLIVQKDILFIATKFSL